jgi:RimJ/RimL family protein N-acetyltransferase
MMIRVLAIADADAYFELRRESLREDPLAFASSPEDDIAASSEAVRELLARAPESVVIGAFEPDLIGAVGLYRDPHLKASHKAHLWGMYVTPASRRNGVASGLLAAALQHAAGLPGICWVHLGVSSAAPTAQRLYERAGFSTWGVEPDALRHNGQTAIEYHLAMRLESGAV